MHTCRRPRRGGGPCKEEPLPQPTRAPVAMMSLLNVSFVPLSNVRVRPSMSTVFTRLPVMYWMPANAVRARYIGGTIMPTETQWESNGMRDGTIVCA